MAATYLSSGSFQTTTNNLPVTAAIALPVNTNVVVMWAQCFEPSNRTNLGSPTLNGQAAALSIERTGPNSSSHRMLVFVFDAPVSGNVTFQTTLPVYAFAMGLWAAFNSDAAGVKYGASFGDSASASTVTTGSITCSAGSVVTAGVMHSYSTTTPTGTAGTLGTAVKFLDLGLATSYRTTTGALAWAFSDALGVAWSGIEILGNAGGGGGSAPTVITQPNNATVTAGATATFTAAFGNSPTGFQWQISTDGGSTWNNVSTGTGGATAVYTTATLTTGSNGHRFRCTATNAGGSTTTNAAVLTVNATGVLTITSEVLRSEANQILANLTLLRAYAIKVSDNTLAATWASPATNASGVLVLASANLTAEPHVLVTVGVGGTQAGAKVYVPA